MEHGIDVLLADDEEQFVLTRRIRGFSLIELVTVVLVLGVMFMAAMPAYRTWMANSHVRTVAETFQNDLRYSQAEAVRRNRQVALVLTNSTPTVASPSSQLATSARNWALYALPLLSSGEGANGITEDTQEGGTTGFIRGHVQDAASNVAVKGDVAAICFNSVGRLTTSSAAIANASNTSCSVPTDNSPRQFRIQDDSGGRPLWIQVYLGGKVRMCDPNKTLPNQPDGCCTSLCCGQSGNSKCIY